MKKNKPVMDKKYHPKEAVLENGKKDKRFWSYKPLRNKHLQEVRADAWAQRTVHFYINKRRLNIILWSVILIEPILNWVVFLIVFYTAPTSPQFWNWGNFQWMVGFIGAWVAFGILIIYLSFYIPIIIRMKIFCWEVKGQIVVVYVGIIKTHLAIDSYIWDKKPRSWSACLVGELKDGTKIELRKKDGAYKVVLSDYPVPTPII